MKIVVDEFYFGEPSDKLKVTIDELATLLTKTFDDAWIFAESIHIRKL